MTNIKPVEKQNITFQCIAASVVSLQCLIFGMLEGWNSPNIILLQSNQSPLPSGKITIEEASYVASLHCIGCMFGNVFFGYITNIFGRKLPLTIITIPIILSWLLIWFAQNVYYLYASKLLAGFFSGAGAFTIVPLFLNEISSDRIRGTLMSTVALSETIGMLLSLIFGELFDFYAIPKLAIALTTIFAILVSLLPEKPIFLVKRNRISEAEKSIKFYQKIRGTDNDRYLLDLEINKIKHTIDDTFLERNNKNSFVWSELPKGIVVKAIIVGIILAAMTILTGGVAMMAYSATIFQESGSSLSPNLSAIVVGIIQLFGTGAATYLVERLGRKLLLTVSNLGTAFGLTVLGAYTMLKSWEFAVETYNWIPLTSFSVIILFVAIGILQVPMVLMNELMPEKIKEAGVSLCMCALWAFTFTIIKMLPFFTEILKLHGIMFIFAGISVCSALFTMLVIPETKNKSHDEIMMSLKKL